MDLFQFLSYQTNLYKIDFYKWLCLYLDIIENEGQLNDFPGLNKGLNEWIITSNVKGFKYWMKQTFMLPLLWTPFFFTLIYSGVFHREQSSLFQERPDHSHTATHSHLEVAYHEHNLICHWAATLEQLALKALLKGTSVMVMRESHVLPFTFPTQMYPSGPGDWTDDILVASLRLPIKDIKWKQLF